ncbi:MAG TPA: TonB-dependent receptor [Caulobacteraceae bacterium]
MKHHILLATCALSALSLGSGSALAAAAAANTTSATSVEEIVVTAEKREANLQEVPMQVTAFTSKDRALKGINTVQDMTNFTPGFTYSSQLDRPAMRGLARNNNIYLSDSSVAVYYDDVFSNSTFFVGRDDMLIDQVEILIGPQGTLYGRNAIGGLINTITKRPSETPSGEVRAEFGNYDYRKFEGTVSGPLFGNLSFRLSALTTDQDRGYFNNLAGRHSEGGVVHDPYIDAQLQYKDDKNEAWLDFYQVAFHNDRGGPGSLLGTPTTGPYDTDLTTPGNIFFNPNFPYGGGAVPGSVVGMVGTNNPALGNIRNFAHSLATDINVDEAYNLDFHFTHHFDGLDVKYVGGYGQYHYNLHTALFGNDNSPITQYQIPLNPGGECALLSEFAGVPCGPLTVFPEQDFSYETHTKWYSNELTISSTWNRPLQYIFGLYQYTETDDNLITVAAHDQPQLAHPIAAFPGQAAVANPGHYYYFTDYQDRIDSKAIYGQLDWKILPTLKLTGGLRYTYDKKRGNEEARFIAFDNFDPGLTNPFTGVCTGGDATGCGTNPANLGTFMPAIDITPALISFAPAQGVTCATTQQLTGRFAGDYTRCLGDTSHAITGTAGIEWTPDPDTLVYARYNRGYKAFGLNAGVISTKPEAPQEAVNDYEIGFKKTFGHVFTLDADAFYYDYSNDQVPLDVPTGGINLTQFLTIPKAVSEGIEFVADWRPIEHLELTLTYALDHTRITSTCPAGANKNTPGCYIDALDPSATQPGARPVTLVNPADPNDVDQLGIHQSVPTFIQAVNGNQLPQAPENKLAFNANYTFVFEPGNLTLSGTFIWKDKSYSSIFQRPYYEAPSWNQVDLRATWSGDHDKYEIVLYVKNLFNSLGYDAASSGYPIWEPVGSPTTPVIANSYDLTPPRLYGVEFHYKF